MTTLSRWAEEGATAEELRLLEASRRERPAAEARLRTLLALGVSGPTNGSPPSGGASSLWRGWRLGTTGKLAILVVCGGGAIAGAGWFALAHRTPVAAGVATASAQLAAPIVPPPTISPAVAETVKSPSLGSATTGTMRDGAQPPLARAKRAIHRVGAAPPACPTETSDVAKPPVAESTLSAEVAALERAQAALAARDTEGAMRALDRYEVTFPVGRLASEATVLRVQALLARGKEEAASAVADRFFTVHPDSSYTRRIRDLLHDAKEHQTEE